MEEVGLKLSSTEFNFQLADVVDAIWEGLTLQRTTTPAVALSFAINAHAECTVYLSGEEIGVDRLHRAFVGPFKVSPAAAEIALDGLATLLARYFNHGSNRVAGREGEQKDPCLVLEESFWELINFNYGTDYVDSAVIISEGCNNDSKSLLSDCIRGANWVGQLLSSAVECSNANMVCCKDRVGDDSSVLNTATDLSEPSPNHHSHKIYKFCSSLFWRSANYLNPSHVAFMRHVVDVACNEERLEEVTDLVNRCVAILQLQKDGKCRRGTNGEIQALVDLVKSLSEHLQYCDKVLQLCRLVVTVPTGGKWASQVLCYARSISSSFDIKCVHMVNDCVEKVLSSEELSSDMLKACIGVEEEVVGWDHHIDEENDNNLSLVSFSSVRDALNRCPDLAVSLFPALIKHQGSLRPSSVLHRLTPYLLHIVFNRAFLDENDESCPDFLAWDSYTTSTSIDEETWDKFIELVIADPCLFDNSVKRSGVSSSNKSSTADLFIPVAPTALLEMLMVELRGNAPTRTLRVIGITSPEVWKSDITTGGGQNMWSLTREVLISLSSQQERLSLLQKASVNQLDFLSCLICMLQAGESDGSAAALLIPPGDLELSRLWKYGIDSMASKIKWLNENQLKKSRNGDGNCDNVNCLLLINAEGLGLLAAALEKEEEEVYHSPLPLRRSPLCHFNKVPDVGTEAFYIESSVSVQHVKIIAVHQDPDEGQQPFVTILPFGGQNLPERQTTLSRLRKSDFNSHYRRNSSSSHHHPLDRWIIHFGAPEPVTTNIVHVDVSIELWHTTVLPLLRESGRKILESFSPFEMTESVQCLDNIQKVVIPILKHSASSCIRSLLLSEDSEVQAVVAKSFALRGYSTEVFCATIVSVCTEWLGILETSATKASETRISYISKSYFIHRACIAAEVMSASFMNTLVLAKTVAVRCLSAMEKMVLLSVPPLPCTDQDTTTTDFIRDCSGGHAMREIVEAALLLVKSISESIRKYEWKGDDFSTSYSKLISFLVLCTKQFFQFDRIPSHSSFVSSNSKSCGWDDSSIIKLFSDAWIACMKCSNREAISLDVIADISIFAVKMMAFQSSQNTTTITDLVVGIAELSYGLSFDQRRTIWYKVIKDEQLLGELVDIALLTEPNVTTLPAIAVLSAAIPALLALHHPLNSTLNCTSSSSTCEEQEEDVYLSKEQQAEKDCEIVQGSLPYVVMRVIQYLSVKGDSSSHHQPLACSSTDMEVFHDHSDSDGNGNGSDLSSSHHGVWKKGEEWMNYFTSTPVNPDLARLVVQRWSPNYNRKNGQETTTNPSGPPSSSSSFDYEAFLVLQRWALVLEILNSAGFQNTQLELKARLALSGVISHKRIFLLIIPLCFSCLQVRQLRYLSIHLFCYSGRHFNMLQAG